MSCEKHCEGQCSSNVSYGRSNNNFLIIVVLYILLAIILSSLIRY